MNAFPTDPFALVPPANFAPTKRRMLQVGPAEAELLWMPERATRGGVPGTARPAFRPSPVERICREESVWEGSGPSGSRFVLTPNKFPFASRHAVVWHTEPVREADHAMLSLAFTAADDLQVTAVTNAIGAAASIARAHFHLLGETKTWLDGFGGEPWEDPSLDRRDGVTVERLLGFPGLCLRLRGGAEDRATAVARLLEIRTTTAFNLIGMPGISYLLPRAPIEIPAPWFPQALGAAELWGRWCFHDEDAYENATSDSLMRAFETSALPH